jgi:hypothetical protein
MQNGYWLVHHDSVPTHTAPPVQWFMTKNNCNFLLHVMKLELKGKRFNDVLETQQNSQQVLNGIMKGVSYMLLTLTEMLGSRIPPHNT